MLLNCGVGGGWKSFGLQRDPTSLSWRKSVLNVHWKDWCWKWSSNTLANTSNTDAKYGLIWKDPDVGKDWKQEEKGTTEDEMIERHHRLNGYEFEQAPGVSDGQGSLVCCSPGVWKNQTQLKDWTDWLRIVLILSTITEYWIYFSKHAGR